MTPAEPLTAPPQLTFVADRVQEHLSRMFDVEQRRWADVDRRLAEAVTELAEHVLRGGKRLRAAFCYWAAVGAAGSEPAGVWEAAAAFELLQGFALIHDDVMDDADTRRGEPTVHVRHAGRLVAEGWRGEPRRYGEGVAILVGDLGHVYADRLAGSLPRQAREIWDELRIELNLGQYLDMRSAAAGDVDAETASRITMFKSGLYTIVRPLQLGASLATDPDPAVLDALDRYGRPVGRAFQLRDDLLGVLGDETAVGKPVGADLREGKATELLATALERADPAERRLLEQVGDEHLDADVVQAMVDVLHRTGAVAAMEARIEALIDEATSVADELPFAEAAIAALVDLAVYVGGRDH